MVSRPGLSNPGHDSVVLLDDQPIRPVQIIKILPCRPVLNPESLPRTHRPDKRSRQSASIRTGIETYGKPAFESRIERNIIRSSPHKSPTYMFSGTDSPRVRLERTVSKTACKIVVLEASDLKQVRRSTLRLQLLLYSSTFSPPVST